MAVHRFRIALDTDIPEHRVIWEQISGLSPRGRVQFLRTHLYLSVKALADRVVGAAAEIAPGASGSGPLVADRAPPATPALTEVAVPQASASSGRKLKPFLGGAS